MANSAVCQSKWKPIVEPRRAKPKTYRQAMRNLPRQIIGVISWNIFKYRFSMYLIIFTTCINTSLRRNISKDTQEVQQSQRTNFQKKLKKQQLGTKRGKTNATCETKII